MHINWCSIYYQEAQVIFTLAFWSRILITKSSIIKKGSTLINENTMNVGLLLYFQWIHLVNINAFNWAQAILSINISGTLHKQCFRGKKVTFFHTSISLLFPHGCSALFLTDSVQIVIWVSKHCLPHIETHTQPITCTDRPNTHTQTLTHLLIHPHTHTHKQAHISCLCVHFLNFAYNFPQCNHAQPLNSKFVGSSLFSQIKLQNIKLSPRPQREFDVFQWTALCFA